jgi:hypothetical protein
VSFSTINNAEAPSAGTSSTTDLKPASHPLRPPIVRADNLRGV